MIPHTQRDITSQVYQVDVRALVSWNEEAACNPASASHRIERLYFQYLVLSKLTEATAPFQGDLQSKLGYSGPFSNSCLYTAKELYKVDVDNSHAFRLQSIDGSPWIPLSDISCFTILKPFTTHVLPWLNQRIKSRIAVDEMIVLFVVETLIFEAIRVSSIAGSVLRWKGSK